MISVIPTLAITHTEVLLLITFVCLFCTTIYSSILVYHWYAYGTDRSVSRTATALYLAGVALAFAGMGAGVLMTT